MSDADNRLDPQNLQARWVLGGVEPDEFVELAVKALMQGFEGTTLSQIAGLSNPTAREVGDLAPRLFAEFGLRPINKDEAVAILIARGEPTTHPVIVELRRAFPDFSERWKRHVAGSGGNPAGFYIDMAELVHFVVEDLYEKGNVEETRRFFHVLEQLLSSADQERTDLIGLGFFETLQNFASWRPGGNRLYEQFFGPISKQIWAELRRIWAGKTSLADVIRAEQKRNVPLG